MSDEEFDPDFLPEPIKFPARRTQPISTGKSFFYADPDADNPDLSVDVPIILPSQPAQIFHDTPDENVIDGDLDISTAGLRNLVNMWPAVRDVKVAIDLQKAIDQGLMNRRKLANKQLGTKDVGRGGTIYSIPD